MISYSTLRLIDKLIGLPPSRYMSGTPTKGPRSPFLFPDFTLNSSVAVMTMAAAAVVVNDVSFGLDGKLVAVVVKGDFGVHLAAAFEWHRPMYDEIDV